MSIQLTISNSLESLAELLSQKIKTNHQVFLPAYVVTQTEGMNNWLKQEIASKLGIAANIQFIKPNDLVHFAFRTLGGRYVKPISAHDLTWVLFEILNEPAFKKSFPKIAKYYDPQPGSEVKRIALATKIADLFDQYQVYRAEVISSWNSGRSFYSRENDEIRFQESWQKDLWSRAKAIAKDKFPDKDYIGSYILKAVQEEDKIGQFKTRFPRIYFFGLSLITEYHLQIFTKLSDHVEVDFLIQNPAPLEYWYEDKSTKVIEFMKRKGILPPREESLANPLLVTWGKLTQDIFRMLFQDENILNAFDQVGVEEPTTDTLLHYVQNTIFNNYKDKDHGGQALPLLNELQIKDETITINSCYSPRREVEVLYNYLVHLVDEKKERLSARDIVVMVPDIDAYASYIKAVFDQAPYRFYYTISDKNEADSDTIVNALIEVLSITEQQFTSEKIMGLLGFSSIRENFQISDLVLIRRLVDAANIRFGTSGNQDDETYYVSWLYGLQRIMFGLCMSGGAEYGEGPEGFYPVDEVEGFDIENATRFVYFVQTLMASLKKRKSHRTVKEWGDYIEETIAAFVGEKDEVDNEEFVALHKQIDRYNTVDSLFNEKISFEVFSHDFLPSLDQTERNKVFISGGITFCSLIPMRSIPFKVVALLGLNFDQFPRTEKRANFDLMQLKKKKDDRNLKENDKHLFLETLLSAKDYFYVSYIGQSIKDNSVLLPSVLIDELIDFISVKTGNPDKVREELVTRHPLHNFSAQYNADDPHLYSYLSENNPDPVDLKGGETERFDFNEIEISTFIKFLKNPFKGYYNSVLNIYYEEDDLTLAETELFTLDTIQDWKLKFDLLSVAKPAEYMTEGVKKGFLPLKNMKEVIVNHGLDEVQYLKNALADLRADIKEETVVIRLQIGDSQLAGKIGGIYGERLLRFCLSKSETKYRLAAYIEYLILKASGKEVKLSYLNKEGQQINNATIDQTEAISRLTLLVNLFKKGHEQMIPIPEGFTAPDKKLDEESLKRKLNDFFTNPHIHPDKYSKKEFNNGFFEAPDLLDKFLESSAFLIQPVKEFFVD